MGERSGGQAPPSTTMRKYLIIVVTLALICRLAVYATVTRHDHLSATTPFAFTNIDSPTYDRLGLNLARHGVYSESADPTALAPAAERGPGYPALIALVYRLLGHRPQAVLLLQIILSSLTAGLVCLIGYRLAGPLAGLAGGLLLALDLPSVIYANLFLTETLAALINLLAIWALASSWRSSGRRTTLLLFATGALAGLAAYVRTAALLWPLVLAACAALYYWRTNKRLSLTSPACLLAAYLLVLSPWVLRNAVLFGTPQFSSGAGNCLLLFNASAVVAARDGITQDQAIDRMGDEVRARLTGTPQSQFTDSRLMTGMALAIFRDNPALTARLFVRSFLGTIFGPGKGYLSALTTNPLLLTAVSAIIGTAAMLLAFYSLCAVARNPQLRSLACVILLSLLYAGAVAFLQGHSRWRVPYMPLTTLAAGLALHRLLSRARPQKEMLPPR